MLLNPLGAAPGRKRPWPIVVAQQAATLQTQIFNNVGPWLTPTEMLALGGWYANWQEMFAGEADIVWANEADTMLGGGTIQGEGGGNYYDRVKIWYVMWARTLNETYRTRARAQAKTFLDTYLLLSTYGDSYTAGQWMNPEGLACYYWDMNESGNTVEAANALRGISRMASWWGSTAQSSFYYLQMTNGTSWAHDVDPRLRAYSTKAVYWARFFNVASEAWSGRGGLNLNWTTNLNELIEGHLAAQMAGNTGWAAPINYNENPPMRRAPFMSGLMYDIFTKLYDVYSQDARIITALRGSMDYEWANLWDAGVQAFQYTDDPAEGTAADPILNLMIAPGYSWMAKHLQAAGDAANAAVYRARAVAIFDGGVDAWYGAPQNDGLGTYGKSFNQFYNSSFRAPVWIHQGAPAPQPPTNAPVLSVSTITTTTAVLAFANIADAVSYEFSYSSINGTSGFGPETLVPSNKAITGLSASTNYWVRVRGKNTGGAGPWSNVVAITTSAVNNATFDPANKSSGINLLQDNLLYENTVQDYNHALARQTTLLAGKKVWRVQMKDNANGETVVVGICTSDQRLERKPTMVTNIGWNVNTRMMHYGAIQRGNGTTSGSGVMVYIQDFLQVPINDEDYVDVAVDMTARLIWFGVNGQWQGDPAAGTGGISVPAGDFYGFVSNPNGDNFPPTSKLLLVTTADGLLTPPAGFSWLGP